MRSHRRELCALRTRSKRPGATVQNERAHNANQSLVLSSRSATQCERRNTGNRSILHGNAQFAQGPPYRTRRPTQNHACSSPSPTRSPRTSYQPYQPVEARPACDQSFIDRRDRSAEPGGRGPDDVNKVIVRGVLSQNVPAQRSIASETARTRSVNQQGRPRYNG